MKKIKADIELVEVDANDLIPYENNPRQNEHAVEAVAESIKQCGYIAPIVVDENMVVLAGHTRLKAIKMLGKEKVQVEIVKGLNEAQKRKYRLLDNKTGEFAQWDFKKLKEEVKDLDFGFDFGIDGLLQRGDNLQELKEKNSKPKNDTLTKVCTCPRCGNQWEE